MEANSEHARLAFADSLLSHFSTSSPFTGNKSEMELAIFRAMFDGGLFQRDATDFEIAFTLKTTPTRIAALRYRLLLERTSAPGLFEDLARHIILRGFEDQSELLLISVEEKFYRDLLQSELRKISAFTDGSHRAAVLKVPADDLLLALENLNPKDSAQVRAIVKKFIHKRRATSAAGAFKDVCANVAAGIGSQLLSKVLGL